MQSHLFLSKFLTVVDLIRVGLVCMRGAFHIQNCVGGYFCFYRNRLNKRISANDKIALVLPFSDVH